MQAPDAESTTMMGAACIRYPDLPTNQKSKTMAKMTKKEREARIQQVYGKCVSVEVDAINGGNLFDVCMQPLENEQQVSFIKDVRALLDKYFSGKYYDFEVSEDE